MISTDTITHLWPSRATLPAGGGLEMSRDPWGLLLASNGEKATVAAVLREPPAKDHPVQNANSANTAIIC